MDGLKQTEKYLVVVVIVIVSHNGSGSHSHRCDISYRVCNLTPYS